MAIITEKIEQKKFDNYDDTRTWVHKSNKNFIRVPLLKFLSGNSIFYDDEYFGDADYLVRFNDQGFQAFCYIIGIRQDILKLIEYFTAAELRAISLQSVNRGRNEGTSGKVHEGLPGNRGTFQQAEGKQEIITKPQKQYIKLKYRT